ncbi:MAG: hypothetical protein ACOVP7_11580 [Lacibacter sp.]
MGQKLQYSKNIIKEPGAGELQLLANINGFHHLLYLSLGGKPVLYIFNEQLQLHATRELNLRFPEKCDIRLLKLNDHYLLYMHSFQPSYHQLMRFNKEGIAENVSYMLNDPADSLWNKSTATFQLFNNDNKLQLIAHTYHDQLKKIRTTLVNFTTADSKSTTQVLFPFDLRYDDLKEATLQKDQLLILKTSKDDDDKNILSFYKIDINSGQLYAKQFESGRYVYFNPKFRYNSLDSSFFLYSMLKTPLGYNGARPGMFMARLNSTLNELSPVKILPNIFRNNVVSAFMVEKTNTLGWVSSFYFHTNSYRNNSSAERSSVLPGFIPPGSDFRSYIPEVGANSFNFYNYNDNKPTAVLMTLLNSNLERAKDSLVKNDGNYYKIHPWPYAHFTMQNRSYLLLVEELVARKKGLLLVYPNEKGHFETIHLRVQSSYNFLLAQLQIVENKYIIIPYTNKGEMGLLKVTFTN